MIKNRRYFIVFIMMVVAVLSATANNRICNYDIKQGLPDNTVNCIAQDNRGFIWTGTSNGLAQFDGMFFTMFRHSNNDTTSISNNNVHSLLATEHGLYIATDYGVNYYSYMDSKFHRCKIKAKHKTGNSFISLVETSGAFSYSMIWADCTVRLIIKHSLTAYPQVLQCLPSPQVAIVCLWL